MEYLGYNDHENRLPLWAQWRAGGYKDRPKRGMRAKAKEMRENPSGAERVMFERIGSGQLGVDFLFQEILYGYIADFFCPELGLVVEVDGPHHEGQQDHDRRRDVHMVEKGLYILRIPVSEIDGRYWPVLTTLRIQRVVEEINEAYCVAS
jgi:very-short-patch-repair endonuclease